MPQRKKPVIYLFVVLPVLVGGGLAIILAEIAGFANYRGISRSAIPDINGMLISLPTFFLWIPLSLIVSNLILFAVPALRHVAEQYVAESKRPGFRDSQRQLFRIAIWMAALCVPLIALGFVL